MLSGQCSILVSRNWRSAPAYIEFAAVFHRLIIKVFLKMAHQVFFAHFGAVNRFFNADAVHDPWEGSPNDPSRYGC